MEQAKEMDANYLSRKLNKHSFKVNSGEFIYSYTIKGFMEEKNYEKRFWSACDYPNTKKGFLDTGKEVFWVELEGRGAPLIIVHGGPGVDHRYFHPCLSSLAEIRTLIYYDLRGHYMSPQSLSGRSHGVREDADDLESLRKALGLKKADFMGHSYGGHVILFYLQKYSVNVKKTILLSAPLGETEEQIEKRLESDPVTKMMKEAKSEEERDKLYIESSFHTQPPPDVIRNNKLVKDAYGSSKNKLLMEAYEKDDAVLDQNALFSSLEIPMLFIAGKHDLIVNVEAIGEVVSDSRSVEFRAYEESGHDPFVDEQERFAKDVNRFLSRGD